MTKVFLPKLGKFILIGLIFINTAISAATSVGAGLCEKRTERLDCLITRFYRDTKNILTSPFHWNQKSLLSFASLSIGTFELMLEDRNLLDLVQDHRTSTTNKISKWTDRYYKRVTNLSIAGFYLSGVLFRDNKAKQTALLCLESVALAEGITKGIKHLMGRTRPFSNKGTFHFDPLKFPPPSSSLSFPSGHTTTAFALSSVIVEQYRNVPLAIALYGWATVVALAWVNNNAHFVSDVLWGGIIGISVGRTIVRFNKKNTSEDVRIGLLSNPDLSGEAGSLGLGIKLAILTK